MEEILVFVRVVDARSISGAAVQLNMPKSTVSRTLARLEERLGVSLLIRSTRQIQLTHAGRLFYDHSRQLLAQWQRAQDAVAMSPTHLVGRLRVSVASVLGGQWLSQLHAAMHSAHPSMSLNLMVEAHPQWTASGGADVVLTDGPPHDASWVSQPLAGLTSVVCASPDYLQRHDVPTTPQQLRGHRALLYSQDDRAQQGCWPFADAEIHMSAALVSNSIDVLHRAALSGCGVLRIPRALVAEDIANGTLQVLLEGQHIIENQWSVCHRGPSPPPPHIAAFVQLVHRCTGGETNN